jgi:hypothetical protein
MTNLRNYLTKEDLKWLANFLDEHKQYEEDNETIQFYEDLINRIGASYDIYCLMDNE